MTAPQSHHRERGRGWGWLRGWGSGWGHGRAHAHAASDVKVWRLPVLALVVASLVGAGLVARARPAAPARPGVPGAAVLTAPAGSESSSWYCMGGTGTAGAAADPTLLFLNTGSRTVTGTVTVVNDAGASAAAQVTVPAGREVTSVPDQVEQGNWLASRVDLDGGGVTVSEVVDGAGGWAAAPCATTASPTWYFASGSTHNGSTMYVALFNPEATAAVVDLTFVTPSGASQPQPFEGLVLEPGALVVAGVAAYVQDQPAVSTVVQARSGRVVAEELQEHAVGGVSGLSLRLGSPSPEPRWSLPRSVNVTGGRVTMVVFNPTSAPERVTVRVRLPSGPVAPYRDELAPDAAWDLVTSTSSRIPANVDYATTVTSSGGPGVVVDRLAQSSSAGAVPQWGAVSAVAGAVSSTPSKRWVVPALVVPATSPLSGVAPFALDLENPGRRTVVVHVGTVTPGSAAPLGGVRAVRIPPGAFTVVEPDRLAPVVGDPLMVGSTGPLAVMEDAVPAGMPGVVALAAIPLGE